LSNKVEIFLSQLWPIFSIEQRKKLLQRLENLPEDRKAENVIDLELENLFLLRRVRDPGFYKFILEKVAENESLLKKIRNYIRKIFTENIDKIDEALFKISEGEKPEEPNESIQIAPIIIYPSDSKEIKKAKASIVNKDSLKYFQMRLEQALKKDDIHEIRAIQSLMVEYTSGEYVGFWLFGAPNPYLGSSDVEHWKYLGKRFKTENIKYESLYNLDPTMAEDLFRAFIFSKKLNHFILNSIIKEIWEDYDTIIEDNLAFKNKFLGDIVAIASLIWFKDKNYEAKTEILNTYYPFSIDFEFLKRMVDNQGEFEFLNSLSRVLYDSGYAEETKTVSEYGLSICKENIYKYIVYGNIATADRELGDYENALKFYLAALNILENIDEQSYQKLFEIPEEIDKSNFYEEFTVKDYYPEVSERKRYQIAIAQKNIAEAYFMLSKHELAEDYYNKVKMIMNDLSNKGKIAILLNLAYSNRRIHDFENEYRYLSKILELGDEVVGGILDYVSKRLEILNQNIDLSKGGKLNLRSLIDSEIEDKATFYFNKGIRHFHSFQFESAIKWFEKSLQIIKDLEVLEKIGIIYFTYKSVESSKDYFEQILEINPEDFSSIFYLGIINLIEGENKCGINQIIQAMNIYLETGENRFNLLNEFLIMLIQMGFLNQMTSIIEGLADHPKNPYDKGDFYNRIAIEFTELGFFSEGIKYFEKAISFAPTPQLKAQVINNLGTNFASHNFHEEALKYYQQAIELWSENHNFWLNMADSYFNLLNFLKAIECIDKAIELAPIEIKPVLKTSREIYEEFNRQILNLNAISNGEIKQMLYSAEHMIQNLKEDKTSLDFSIILVEYAKSLEKMLDENITSNFKIQIKQNYPKSIPSNYWDGNGKIPPLPPYLKNVIRKGNSIPLGNWNFIIDKLQNKHHPIEDELKEYIKTNFTPDEIKIIKEACDFIGKLRGGPAHKEVKDKKTVMGIRNEIIIHLNKVINLLYTEK